MREQVASDARSTGSSGGRYRVRFRSVLLAVFGLSGCGSTEAIGYEPTSGEVRPEMVTGAAQGALGPDGRFRLPFPTLGQGQLTLAFAREQALQFARYVTNSLTLRNVVEVQRGGVWVDPHLLVLCSDAYYVRSQLNAFDASAVPEPGASTLQRQTGPKWLIPLCDKRNVPTMTVQLAINSNDVVFKDYKPVVDYRAMETAIYPAGIPEWHKDALPISAERAVRYVFDQSARRIAGIPELYARGRIVEGQYTLGWIAEVRACNLWRIQLEHPITVVRPFSLESVTTSEVFVGTSTCAPHDTAPLMLIPVASTTTRASVAWNVLEDNTPKYYRVPVTLAQPVTLEPVGVKKP